MSDTLETKYYRDPATGKRYRVRIIHDDDAMSPRDADNVTVMHTFDQGYNSPEDLVYKNWRDSIFPREYDAFGASGEYDIPDSFDLRRARKYAALDPDILMVRGVDRTLGGWTEGGLELSDDDETSGYIAITRQSWEMCMGDVSTFTLEKGKEVMLQDIEEYNRWARGEYVGAVVEEEIVYRAVAQGRYGVQRTHTEWEEVESCWGYDDQDYALEEALSWLPDNVEEEETD